ncbi:MAG: hypothetical protein ACRDI3_03840 [Actinomycetota bacterium]
MGAWRVAPLLPVLTVAPQVMFYWVETHWVFLLLALPGLIFGIGYVGTERLWYLAIWTNRPFRPSDVWRTTWRYFPRYLGLGIVTMIAYFLLLIPVSVVSAVLGLDFSLSRWQGLILPTLVWDIWLTFMTPALAYVTDQTSQGMAIGWKFLKDHWRRCMLYALAPPLAGIILLQRGGSEALDPRLATALAVPGALIYLALKGATAAYFVRHYPVSVEELEAAANERPRRVTAR